MIINDLDGYYIVFDTKNWNTELDTLSNKFSLTILKVTTFSRIRQLAEETTRVYMPRWTGGV